MDANNGPSSLDPNDLRAVSSEDMDNDGKTPGLVFGRIEGSRCVRKRYSTSSL